ncbi:MAG: OmpA family protein [Pontixanthobacter sp.]
MIRFLTVLGALLLTACQTVPDQTNFSREQVATLTQEGFVPVEENYELGLSNKVLFGFDRSELMSETSTELVRLTRVLMSVGIGGVTIEGHTDNKGASDYNLELSKRRAETVKAAMIAGGMNGATVRTIGYGETDPIEDNATEKGQSENRRVVIVVTPGDALHN